MHFIYYINRLTVTKVDSTYLDCLTSSPALQSVCYVCDRARTYDHRVGSLRLILSRYTAIYSVDDRKSPSPVFWVGDFFQRIMIVMREGELLTIGGGGGVGRDYLLLIIYICAVKKCDNRGLPQKLVLGACPKMPPMRKKRPPT